MGKHATRTYACSFCGKGQRAVRRLIAGPGGVYVCDQCVAACRLAQTRDPLATLPQGTRLAFAQSHATRERCSFCGKALDEVAWMALAANATVICDECVALCEEIITEERHGPPSDPDGVVGASASGSWQATTRAAGMPAPTTTRRHLLDLDDWSPDKLRSLLDRTASMRALLDTPAAKLDTLRGTLLVTLFYENSTRTRVSFELAAKKLGADVTNVTASASSVTKGESLIDTVRTLQALGANVIVVRSPHAGAPDVIARSIRGSVVNTGDGWHAHPTQALLDLFTLQRRLGPVAGKRIAILGDILHSRVARSNVWALTALGAEVVLCGPPTLLPPAATELYAQRPVPGSVAPRKVTVEPSIERALEGADAVMALRLQRERQQAGLLPSLREYTARWGLTPERLRLARSGALVLHPGPMNEGVEIDPAVASGETSVIEEQVTNGVAVRMAVLELLAGARTGEEQSI